MVALDYWFPAVEMILNLHRLLVDQFVYWYIAFGHWTILIEWTNQVMFAIIFRCQGHVCFVENHFGHLKDTAYLSLRDSPGNHGQPVLTVGTRVHQSPIETSLLTSNVLVHISSIHMTGIHISIHISMDGIYTTLDIHIHSGSATSCTGSATTK